VAPPHALPRVHVHLRCCGSLRVLLPHKALDGVVAFMHGLPNTPPEPCEAQQGFVCAGCLGTQPHNVGLAPVNLCRQISGRLALFQHFLTVVRCVGWHFWGFGQKTQPQGLCRICMEGAWCAGRL
jgi:hypothetical protein